MSKLRINAEDLAKRLDAAIQHRGMTYNQVAKVTGIEASRISKFCNGKFKCISPVLKRLCIELKIPIQDLSVGRNFEAEIEDIVKSIRHLAGGDPAKAKVLRKLFEAVKTIAGKSG